MTLLASILEKIKPTSAQQDSMRVTARALVARANDSLARHADADSAAEAVVQGSIAKDTWIADSRDLDLFLLLHPDTPADQLAAIAKRVADDTLEDVQQRYAQHPYQVGTFQGCTVDLVPAYRVQDGDQAKSAVDRTPFHTAWVCNHLDDAARDQVRLVKQWCKGTGVYGAETAIGGFSGYLLEVLVHRFGDFSGVLAWLARGANPRALDHGEGLPADDAAVLLVADPVDPHRNVAAAVQQDTLDRAMLAARCFQASPSESFFFPRPRRAESQEVLQAALLGGGWCALHLRPATDRLDIVFPQFQKATRAVAEDFVRAGFGATRRATQVLADGSVLMQWATTVQELPPQDRRLGPPATSDRNAARFRDKWQSHPDAAGPVMEDGGRLVVDVRRTATTPAAHLGHRRSALLQAKHVKLATDASGIVADPADLPPVAAAVAADFILDRSPWER